MSKTNSNNKISIGKFRLDIDDNNGDVTVNVTLRLKQPEDYDSDIVTKSGFDVYVDNVFNSSENVAVLPQDATISDKNLQKKVVFFTRLR